MPKLRLIVCKVNVLIASTFPQSIRSAIDKGRKLLGTQGGQGTRISSGRFQMEWSGMERRHTRKWSGPQRDMSPSGARNKLTHSATSKFLRSLHSQCYLDDQCSEIVRGMERSVLRVGRKGTLLSWDLVPGMERWVISQYVALREIHLFWRARPRSIREIETMVRLRKFMRVTIDQRAAESMGNGGDCSLETNGHQWGENLACDQR